MIFSNIIGKTKEIVGYLLDILFLQDSKNEVFKRSGAEEKRRLLSLAFPREFSTVTCSCAYLLPYKEPVVTECIHAFKFGYDKQARETLLAVLFSYLKECLWEEEVFSECVYITAIPDSKHRIRTYGEGHMSLLLKGIKKEVKGCYAQTHVVNLLRWNKRTHSQHLLKKRKDRKENMKNALECTKKDIGGSLVFVIDDICTTGATLEEAQRALLDAGAGAVRAVVLAH